MNNQDKDKNFILSSDFISQNLNKFPEVYSQNFIEKLDSKKSETRLINFLDCLKDLNFENLNLFKKYLRDWRNQELTWIALRDLSGHQTVLETCLQLSEIAEIALKQTLRTLQRLDNFYLDLDILLMGKLGGRELNFSSDIDLIFVDFSEPGLSKNQDQEDQENKLIKFLRCFVSLLNDNTEDGFVYRVDLRLRPFGQQGPLIMTENQSIRYYQNQGRDWERYALMKSRFLIKKRESCEKALQNFVYQGAPDYSMRQAILKIYQAIQKEQKEQKNQKGFSHRINIKLGEGGIREAEFIVQALQLMHSSQEKTLRHRGFCQALTALVSEKILSSHQGVLLEDAYLFLRDLENKLQIYSDRQTHLYPDLKDLNYLNYLILAMKEKSAEDLKIKLDKHRKNISALRKSLIESDTNINTNRPSLMGPLGGLIPKPMDYFESIQPLDPICQSLLDSLKTPALEAIHNHPDPKIAKEVLLVLFQAIANKKSYLSLLVSNTRQLDRLLGLMVQSPYLKNLVIVYPRLLPLFWIQDESEPRSMGELKQTISHHLPLIDGLENQLDYLREQKLFQLCRIAISDLENKYPIMRVSDFLSELAEVIVQSVCDLAWHNMIERYGFPEGIAYGEDFGFAIIAYGKLGGLELSYTSDLDLVFIYQYAEGVSNGEKSIAQQEFYNRFSQRLTQYLQEKTQYGDLYSVDSRLRPSGQSGLLATPVSVFSQYQRQSAWTWEHQALLRARPIFSNLDLNAHFEQIRLDILCRPRELKKLKQEVRQMREKMRQSTQWQLIPGENLSLKQIPGGIIDIEFLVQYLALLWAHEYPILVRYTDNIRILENLAETKILLKQDAQKLMEIYRQYRNYLHRCTLLGRDESISEQFFKAEREWVWGIFNESLKIAY